MTFIPLTNYLRMYRKRRNLSQQEVATITGAGTRTAVSKHEAGTRLPDIRTALAYAHLYGVPVEKLFSGVSRKVEGAVAEHSG